MLHTSLGFFSITVNFLELKSLGTKRRTILKIQDVTISDHENQNKLKLTWYMQVSKLMIMKMNCFCRTIFQGSYHHKPLTEPLTEKMIKSFKISQSRAYNASCQEINSYKLLFITTIT